MRKKVLGFLLSAFIFSSCGGGDSTGTTAVRQSQNSFEALKNQIYSLPYQEIDIQEQDSIAFVREEEKFARDVYLYLGRVHSLQIFSKIAESEQRHMDAVKLIIDKYGLSDPVQQTGDAEGAFVNEQLSILYTDFIQKGEVSLEEAIRIGGRIEEMDIIDLTNRMNNTDNEDFKLVLIKLRRGSANHLIAFSREYENLTGNKYTPQLLCPEDYEYIVTNCLPGVECDISLQCQY